MLCELLCNVQLIMYKIIFVLNICFYNYNTKSEDLFKKKKNKLFC